MNPVNMRPPTAEAKRPPTADAMRPPVVDTRRPTIIDIRPSTTATTTRKGWKKFLHNVVDFVI